MTKNDIFSIITPIRVAIIASIGGFLFGFDIAVINGAIKALSKTFSIGTWGMGFAVSISLIGAAIGAFFGGQLAEKHGRVKPMIFSAFLFFISSLGAGFAFGFYDFIFWRIIGGATLGAVSIIIPAYIAESSPAKYRGRLGSFQQFLLVTGLLVATISNFIIANVAGSAENILFFGIKAWRFMFLIESIPALLYGILALSLPESPRFLVAKNNFSQSKDILKEIVPPDTAETKMDDIKKTIIKDKAAKISDIFVKNPNGEWRLYPIVLAGIGIAGLQQLVGINVIFYYGNALWQSVGFGEDKALALSILAGAINIIMTIVAIINIDKIGRKPLLLIGSTGMFITLLTMSLIFSSAQINANGNPVLAGTAAWTAVGAANLFVVFFGMSWGPVMWVMLGEMFNNNIRGAALAVAGLTQYLANFLVSTTFPPLAKYFGLGGSYGIYAFFAFFSFFFVLSKIQETKGKELEDM